MYRIAVYFAVKTDLPGVKYTAKVPHSSVFCGDKRFPPAKMVQMGDRFGNLKFVKSS
jgi:hypothetical protein